MNPTKGYSVKAAGGFRSGQMSPPVTRKVFPPMLIVEGYTDRIEEILQRALKFANDLSFNKQSFVYHLKQMRFNYIRFLKQRYNRNQSGKLYSFLKNISGTNDEMGSVLLYDKFHPILERSRLAQTLMIEEMFGDDLLDEFRSLVKKVVQESHIDVHI